MMHKRRMMHKSKGSRAVSYIRVSTDEQSVGALNLDNQERRCREYCLRQGWLVVEVFIDSGESARTVDRPEFQRMLAYCKANRREVGYVVVQDLSRFARNNRDQAETIAELGRIGVLLRSTYESNIDETAAGTMAANVFGTFNQYFSDALSEKMRDRTRQAVSAGRFPWRAPIGYHNVGGKEGPNIVPDGHGAPLIRRAFELMRTGRFKKTEVLKTVTDAGLVTPRGKPLSAQTFHKSLRNPLYAGWVSLPSDESFKMVRGLHEPIVSQALFDDVQAVLAGRSPGAAPKRKLNPAFPLKHFMKCDSCGVPLTGGFCTGRSKRYAYYWCRNPNCYEVKLTGERLEADFLALLRRLRPYAGDVANVPQMAAKVWAAAQGDTEKEVRLLEGRLAGQKRRKRKLLDSMLDGKISDATYKEAEVEFCVEIAVLEKELRALDSQQMTQDAFLRFVNLHMVDVAGAWQLATVEQKHRVQNLLFEGGLFYSEKAGILNRSNSCLFSTLELLRGSEVSLASPTGFEPVLSP
jgi:site-specific DNA recombinase